MQRKSLVSKKSSKKWMTIGNMWKFNLKSGETQGHLSLQVLRLIKFNKSLTTKSSKLKQWKVHLMPKFLNRQSRTGRNGLFIHWTSLNFGWKYSLYGFTLNQFSPLLTSRSTCQCRQPTLVTLMQNGNKWCQKLFRILKLSTSLKIEHSWIHWNSVRPHLNVYKRDWTIT